MAEQVRASVVAGGSGRGANDWRVAAQVVSNSNDEYASEGEGYDEDSYEDEAGDAPASGRGGECAAAGSERIEEAGDRDAADYGDEFEGSELEAAGDTQGYEEKDAAVSAEPAPSADYDGDGRTEDEEEEDAAPLNNSRKFPRPLVPSRSFSVPAVPSVPLPAAETSQRSASVPSVPLAAIGRLAKGYEEVYDGEDAPRARHELVLLPVVDEANGISLSELDEESESELELDDSNEPGSSAEDPGKVRMRALSLQHIQQQSVVLPARRSKSHLYLHRLSSVSELVAEEDVATLALPALLSSRGEPSGINSIQDTANNLKDDADANATSAHDAYAVLEDVISISVTDTLENKEFVTENHHAITNSVGALDDLAQTQTENPSNPRRETEQLMWEVQALITAQRNDLAEDEHESIAAKTCSTQSTTLQEVDAAASGEEDGADQYGEEEFSDDEQTGQEDSYFSDDEEPDGQINENLHTDIYSIADMDDDNRQETDALLREAQSLLQVQNSLHNSANNNQGSRPESAGYGEDEEFEDEEIIPLREEPSNLNNNQSVVVTDSKVCNVAEVGMTAITEVHSIVPTSSSTQQLDGKTSQEPASESTLVASLSECINIEADANPLNSVDTCDTKEPEHTPCAVDTLVTNALADAVNVVSQNSADGAMQLKPQPPPKKALHTPGPKSQSSERASPRPTPPTQSTRKSIRAHSTNPVTLRCELPPTDQKVAAKPHLHVSRETSNSNARGSSDILARSPIRESSHELNASKSRHGSPVKVSSPRPDEYPVLPRKDPVPTQKIPKKRPQPDCRRELKPVKSPPNLRITIPGVDKAKRDWLFLNMFRHGDDVSKYEPFVPRSAFPRPPASSNAGRPQTAESTPWLNDPSPYSYGGRRLRKPEDPALVAREKNWVATKPHDCAIPTYDSILDKYCVTVTSPVIQRQIYQTRYDDLSPQLAFVLEKRVERQWKESLRSAEATLTSYRMDPCPPE